MSVNTLYPERRQFPRFEFNRTPWIFSLNLKPEHVPQSPMQLEVQNISLGGVKFRSNRKIGIFEEVKIQLLDKENDADIISISGKVVRVDETDIGVSEKTYGMAIALEEVTDRVFAQMSEVFVALT